MSRLSTLKDTRRDWSRSVMNGRRSLRYVSTSRIYLRFCAHPISPQQEAEAKFKASKAELDELVQNMGDL